MRRAGKNQNVQSVEMLIHVDWKVKVVLTSDYGPTIVRSVTEIPFHVFIL